MLKRHQVVPYDNASRVLAKCGELIAQVNTAGLNAEHMNRLEDLYKQVINLRHDLFSLAHERFVAERRGDAT